MCKVHIDTNLARTPIRTFVSSVMHALLSLVRNGLEYGTVDVDVSRSGDMIHFSVRDNGPGISEDILPRLGEPFFTTKGPGKGMGLGLFITKTFADRIGGSLSFTSEPNRGTTATLSIPDLT